MCSIENDGNGYHFPLLLGLIVLDPSHLMEKSKSSRKHLRTKVTPDLHLTYSKNGGLLRLVLNDKKWKFLHKIICCGDLLESPRGGDSNR